MKQAPYESELEQRLFLYHRRLADSLFRIDATEEKVTDALALAHDHSLPRTAVEFRLTNEFVPGRWPSAAGLGIALENYIAGLQGLEKARLAQSATIGLTDGHRKAFAVVVEAAAALEALGWPVNWKQNVQLILEFTEIGLKDGQLVDRFHDLPPEITLRDELTLLGTVTFYKQYRSLDRVETSFKAAVLNPMNHALYGHVILREATASKHFRRLSEWLPGPSGKEVRVAI